MKLALKSFILFLISAHFIFATEQIKRTQFLLNQLGYNAGSTDGIYGSKTNKALKKFYKNKNEKFDGTLDSNEINDLEDSYERLFINFPKSEKWNQDWNWDFEVNCSLPNKKSIQILKEDENYFVRVQLDNKDIGGCLTDNDAEHSFKFNKPYSERAEVTGKKTDFQLNKNYLIQFKIRFVMGFNTKRRSETFFQIKDCPTSVVPVMAKIGEMLENRRLFVFDLGSGSKKGRVRRSTSPKYNPIDNNWNLIKIYFHTGSPNKIKIYFNDHLLLKETTFPNVMNCNGTDFRIGIYRAGNKGYFGNPLSIVDYDEVNINFTDPF